jgi:hypothetical protein
MNLMQNGIILIILWGVVHMTDVVIAGRISQGLMDELKKLGKSNTELLREALSLYIDNLSTQKPCKQLVNKRSMEWDISSIHEYIDAM